MNLIELHRWVMIRNLLISLFMGGLAYIIGLAEWTEPLPEFYSLSLGVTAIITFFFVLIFFLLNPRTDLSEEQYKNLYSTGKLSRNIYLFSLLMFLTGLMTFSSTAARVSYLFFLLGGVTMPVAHITYALWIYKFKVK